jgi:TusA-related sulfurtransferase
MKTLSLFAAILFSIFNINTATAQTAQMAKTETIKVWGNCGMCKTTIEKAAKKGGAKTANWNEDSKELKVTYAVNKTSSAKIQKSIAKAGYDTQDFTAVQTAYDNLHGCCKYDRKTDASSNAKCCSSDKCGTGADCCAGETCCKEKSCCSKKDNAAAKCCSSEKCGKDAAACKDMKNCKDKACCKS